MHLGVDAEVPGHRGSRVPRLPSWRLTDAITIIGMTKKMVSHSRPGHQEQVRRQPAQMARHGSLALAGPARRSAVDDLVEEVIPLALLVLGQLLVVVDVLQLLRGRERVVGDLGQVVGLDRLAGRGRAALRVGLDLPPARP